MKINNYIIFTDLDGTLLDHNTYQYSEAQPAIDLIKKFEIPLILTSSKTKVEMLGYQKSIGIEGYPYIVENGSAVYTSIDYFRNNPDKDVVENYDRYKLGKNYLEIKNILIKISAKYDYNIRGFHNTDKNEIIEKTKLSAEAVALAMDREFSVPLFYDDKAKEILLKEIEKYNLQILFGGRFMHILGKTDKGKALNLVKNGFCNKLNSESIKTIAIGDTMNDVAMLQNADIKILVKKYNNEYDTRVQIDNLFYSPYIGPKGWNHSLLEILSLGDQNE
ncbi:MAG: HAD-IIB family hydrolase [Calditrichia bacterium]|nr:HAD-IIB family hydrolase [Calditrichia bacterium]